jgi:hypothetical protein
MLLGRYYNEIGCKFVQFKIVINLFIGLFGEYWGYQGTQKATQELPQFPFVLEIFPAQYQPGTWS